jgi:hypothetical protein
VPRYVEVETSGSGPPPAAYLRIRNDHPAAVNVYVTAKTSELFLRQVRAQANEIFPVFGVSRGTLVSLRAKAVDGSQTWSRDSVALADTVQWNLR